MSRALHDVGGTTEWPRGEAKRMFYVLLLSAVLVSALACIASVVTHSVVPVAAVGSGVLGSVLYFGPDAIRSVLTGKRAHPKRSDEKRRPGGR